MIACYCYGNHRANKVTSMLKKQSCLLISAAVYSYKAKSFRAASAACLFGAL
jgi:hypothetical protein